MPQCRKPHNNKKVTVQKAKAQKSRCVEMGNVTTVYEDLTYEYIQYNIWITYRMYRNVYVTMRAYILVYVHKELYTFAYVVPETVVFYTTNILNFCANFFINFLKFFKSLWWVHFCWMLPLNRNFSDAIAVQDLRGIHVWNFVRCSPRTNPEHIYLYDFADVIVARIKSKFSKHTVERLQCW